MERFEQDILVIGAGVVGLAVARALAMRGRDVLVVEAAGAIGTGISSRNSEVVHAGLYYRPGSLKARCCVAGRDRLYAYCAEKRVPHARCGKMIVAVSPSEIGRLDEIAATAARNGVHDLERLDGAEAKRREPEIEATAALYSPASGIVDSHALMAALAGDLESHGGKIAFKARATGGGREKDRLRVDFADADFGLDARGVVNCCGLAAPAFAAAFDGLPAEALVEARYAKGNYFILTGRRPFKRLIYPLPEPGGLGIHVTVDLGGEIRFGPDVEWVGNADAYEVDPGRGEKFYAAIRRYWPALPDGALVPGYSGIRPKIARGGALIDDFVIEGRETHGVEGLVNMFGIESPGLTANLALGDLVADLF